MATTHDPKTQAVGGRPGPEAGPRPYRWTKREYHRLHRLGFFRDRRVELIGGEIMLMTVNPLHCASVMLAYEAIRAVLGPGLLLRNQATLDMGAGTLLQPDLSVVRGSPRDYSAAHPTEALLVVEISDTSLAFDRGIKAESYARGRVEDYWIVNLNDRQLEVHRRHAEDPGRPGRFLYQDVAVVPATGHAEPLVAPGARVAVADLLP